MSKAWILGGALAAIVAGSLVGSALPQAAPVGILEGTVVLQGTAEPLPNVQVLVGGGDFAVGATNAVRGGVRGAATPPLTAVTDTAGHFVLHNVPAGSTVVRARLQGYFGEQILGLYLPFAMSNVTVTPQQPAQVRLSLVAGASFSGRVLDPQGKPLANGSVQALMTMYENGQRILAPWDMKSTDDRGEYRFFRLPPGEYFISASPQRMPAELRGLTSNTASSSSDLPVLTLYPNATEAAAAIPVVLGSGDDRSGFNIQIRTATASTVSGRVISNLPPVTGQRGQGRPSLLMLVARGPGGLQDLAGGATTSPNPTDGTFTFPNVPAGAYEVIARLPVTAYTGWGAGNPPALAANPWAFGRASVDVRGSNVSDLAVVVHRGVDVAGQLLVDGKPSQANVRIGITVDEGALRVTDPQTLNTFGQIMRFQPEIAADGSFTIPLVPEGTYRFQASVGDGVATAAATMPSLPATAYVADIRQGSTSVYDNGLSVGRESVNPIRVVVNTDGGSVEGSVVDAAGKAVASATVVLVPAVNRRQNSALYRMLRSDAQGRFLMNAVPPGLYKVFAWESVPAGAWENAEFLSRYEQRGTPVTVNPSLRTVVEAGSIRLISSR